MTDRSRSPFDDSETVPRWSVESERELLSTRIFSLHERRHLSPDGRRGDFLQLRSVDWVNVIAHTDQDEILFVEQYRHGIDLVTLELPGGMIDDGESPAAAGARELREETGFAGAPARMLGRLSPNPAVQNNWSHVAFVAAARSVAEPTPDPLENLRVRVVPRQRLPELVASGAIHHALVVAALHLAEVVGVFARK